LRGSFSLAGLATWAITGVEVVKSNLIKILIASKIWRANNRHHEIVFSPRHEMSHRATEDIEVTQQNDRFWLSIIIFLPASILFGQELAEPFYFLKSACIKWLRKFRSKCGRCKAKNASTPF